MASASTDPPASRFASPAKKQCIEKDEACYLYYQQATYDDKCTLNGELIVGLCFQRKVSKKFPQGKDLPFPSEEKIEQLKKEVMQGGLPDGRLEYIETNTDKKAIKFFVHSPAAEARVLSIIGRHFKDFQDGRWMGDYQEYVSKYYGITHTNNTSGDVLVYAIEPMRNYLLDVDYEFNGTKTDTYPLVQIKVDKDDGKLEALKELGNHYKIPIKVVASMPSILIKKDNWCDLTTPAPPLCNLHAYQTRDHTLWHPLSLTDPLQEEKNISITSTNNNHCPNMETKELEKETPEKKRKEKRISLKKPSLLDNCMLQHASVTWPLQP